MEEFKPVVFKLEKELYGLDINRVRGIEKEQEVVRVPNTASYIKGIMNLRGDVIPVYSLRKKFGMPEATTDDIQYIIVYTNGTLLALEVDNVDEIHNIEDNDVHVVPSIVTNADTRYFDKVLKTNRGLIITIDIDKLLSDDELSQIEQMKSLAE
ncbi:MAG: chemotaxis protein CheW [Lachnospiraceae bacterium]|nr:chemotaxis protein CheW [Lachnospiraceae bacterium]